ncbi:MULTISPECIES: HypC/HybG/HupF family hydrogenase formation chaperone [Acidianus]|uniref:Hydrogenase expression/formation protein n=1 Tax=Candidatus Acidianus copahuensis TaxID=1160895 RepID=A0A031LJD0_9CREN|nr:MULTISPECIES: HypC/HybG/HupF family hydrogenase formation chaperone [Acidianus]EZQ01600.1 hydrogenase expression/formation protein [Candidatus Acidianus copahuensis]NON61566.1 HypC/HybG/HupF family hydrogenase formation chaperone [Acidianus sp. RZ1]
MCWAVPAKVISIESDLIATVDLGGNTIKKVAVGVDNVRLGDFVMVHAGVIISKLSKEEVIENIKFIAEQIREVSEITGEDPEKTVKEYTDSMYKLLGQLDEKNG